MSSTFGKRLSIRIFGESHGKALGVVLEGLPPGMLIDSDHIRKELGRRSPGRSELSTARKEDDNFEILSGVLEGKTTGTPLSAVIYNSNQCSAEYRDLKYTPRPGHADYTGFIKYGGRGDHRGGGHFSGRLTAPLVFAGALAKQILHKHNIVIGSHIQSIYNLKDDSFNGTSIDKEVLERLNKSILPVLNSDMEEKFAACILAAKEAGDSLGGVIETALINLKAGLGSPFFDGIESRLSHALMAIPGAKGIEFGTGFALTALKGSRANDEFIIKDGKIKTATNHCGGILGGITNGMPLIFRLAIKPTPSIGKKQRTVDLLAKRETNIEIKGRHDPCIVPRAIAVVEAIAAIVITDCIFEEAQQHGNID